MVTGAFADIIFTDFTLPVAVGCPFHSYRREISIAVAADSDRAGCGSPHAPGPRGTVIIAEYVPAQPAMMPMPLSQAGIAGDIMADPVGAVSLPFRASLGQ